MFFVVFFFKQKTAYEMRISDWSSDVCSSDLVDVLGAERREERDVLVEVHMTFGAELVERGVDVDRVPEHDQIHDKPKSAALIFLPFAVTLTDSPSVAVAYGSVGLVSAPAPVELDTAVQPVGFGFHLQPPGKRIV